jgi:hypothetical protein
MKDVIIDLTSISGQENEKIVHILSRYELN